jgi:signal transduction histidine kinase
MYVVYVDTGRSFQAAALAAGSLSRPDRACTPSTYPFAVLLSLGRQITGLMTFIAAIILIPASALGGTVAAHKAVPGSVWRHAHERAGRTAAAVRPRHLVDLIVPGLVVGPVGRMISRDFFGLPFAVQAASLILSPLWAAWKLIGRALWPFKAIRAELDAVNAGDLSRRVSEPSGRGEITRLARTINASLQRLRDTEEQLDRANERLGWTLDRQRQFVRDASHELRTPLAGLRTELEEAQLHPDDTDLGQLSDHALSDVDRLQAIITDLLLLAKIDGGAPRLLEEIDLAEVIHSDLPQRIGDPHPVYLHLEPEIRVTADRTQISRVLANLLDNAQRHATHAVQIHLRSKGDRAELAMTDDGEGIAEGDRERIFQRFTRLDAARSRDHGGTGLGLAIARDIAHSHNGTLHVEDPPIPGACFVLRLPLSHRHRPPGRSDATAGR